MNIYTCYAILYANHESKMLPKQLLDISKYIKNNVTNLLLLTLYTYTDKLRQHSIIRGIKMSQ